MQIEWHDEPIIVPDEINPVIGVRAWKYEFNHGEPKLRSMGVPYTWGDTTVKAECNPPEKSGHDAPQVQCTCGIWALGIPTDLAGPGGQYPFSPLDTVYGFVEMWGEIVCGTKGWRAQYARCLGFVIPAEESENLSDSEEKKLAQEANDNVKRLAAGLHVQVFYDWPRPFGNLDFEMTPLEK